MSGVRNTMHTINITVFSILLLLASPVDAQVSGDYISGTVTDAGTGEPVINANIRLVNTETGTSTNDFGEFILKVGSIPFELEVSHIAYEGMNLRYEHLPLRPLNIRLSPRVEPLTGVVVTSQRIDTLYSDRIYAVLDYELCDRGILLLIFKARLSRAELLLQSYEGEKLLELSILPMKPLGLYRDCLGEIHILSREKAYQVHITEEQMTLYDPYDLDYFSEVMGGCRFKVGSRVYFEDMEYFDLVKRFYFVNTLDTTSHLFAVAADAEKMAFLRQNPENYIPSLRDQESSLLGRINGTAGDLDAIREIRNLNTEIRFNKMAYLASIYAPIYAMKDSLALFNHPQNMIQFYDTLGTLTGETPIEYHLPKESETQSKLVYGFAKRNKWLQEVHVDEIRNKAYTLYQKLNGTRDLVEIDLRTGEVDYRCNIPFAFVQKIEIRDGYLYYIYKGFGEGQKKKLFRQRIL